MPVLVTVAHNYRALAAEADRPALSAGRPPAALEACGSQLQKYFSLAMGRTGAGSLSHACAVHPRPTECSGG